MNLNAAAWEILHSALRWGLVEVLAELYTSSPLEGVGAVFVYGVKGVVAPPTEQLLIVVADVAGGVDDVAPGFGVYVVVQPLTLSLQKSLSLDRAETRVAYTLDGCQRGGGEHRYQQRHQRQMATTLRILSPFLFPFIRTGVVNLATLADASIAAGIVVLAQSPDTLALEISPAKTKKAGAP
jgi:hypothetical protein